MGAAKSHDANLFSDQVRRLADIFLRYEAKGKLVGGGGDEHEIRSLADGSNQRCPVRLREVSASPHQGLSSRSGSRDHDQIGIQTIFRKQTEVLRRPYRRLADPNAVIANQVALLGEESCGGAKD